MKVGVLVVGADPSGRGFGARAHVPAVEAAAGLRLVGVCTSREETARAAGTRWGTRAFSDYREAIRDGVCFLMFQRTRFFVF